MFPHVKHARYCWTTNVARVNCDRGVFRHLCSRDFWAVGGRGFLSLGPNSPLPSLSQTSAEISVWPIALILGCARRAEHSVQTHSYSSLGARKAALSGYSKWCVFLNSCLIGQTVCQYLGFFSPLLGTCPFFLNRSRSSAGRVLETQQLYAHTCCTSC